MLKLRTVDHCRRVWAEREREPLLLLQRRIIGHLALAIEGFPPVLVAVLSRACSVLKCRDRVAIEGEWNVCLFPVTAILNMSQKFVSPGLVAAALEMQEARLGDRRDITRARESMWA